MSILKLFGKYLKGLLRSYSSSENIWVSVWGACSPLYSLYYLCNLVIAYNSALCSMAFKVRIYCTCTRTNIGIEDFVTIFLATYNVVEVTEVSTYAKESFSPYKNTTIRKWLVLKAVHCSSHYTMPLSRQKSIDCWLQIFKKNNNSNINYILNLKSKIYLWLVV